MSEVRLSEIMKSSGLLEADNASDWKKQIQALRTREDKEALAYLRAKFPSVEEKVFYTSYTGEVSKRITDVASVHEAAKIERLCAACKGKCQLLDRNGKPVVSIEKNSRGVNYLSVGWTCGITCRYDPLSGEFGQMFMHSGLSRSQLRQTFDSYERCSVEATVAKSEAMMAANEGTSLILGGRPGTGKTHLASAIAIYAMRHGRQAVFRLTNKMLDQLREANVRDWDTYSSLMGTFEEVPCLVLDDFGKERLTRAVADYLYRIIDCRYRNDLQTIITTNAKNIEELESREDEEYRQYITPMVSRILERGSWVTISNSEDYRLKREVKTR